MTTVTPFLAAAADAKLEDWGPLEEALPISGPNPGGEPMHTSGTTLWSGEGIQEAGCGSARRGRPGGAWTTTRWCISCPAE
jgi:hypothetical protein